MNELCVGVVGQGYVGLPLALEFANRFPVIGYDINYEIIDSLKKGKSHVDDISDSTILHSMNYYPTNNINDLSICDFIIICVPTPLTEGREPDLSYIKSACYAIVSILRKGQFVILESTTYPGTTKEVVVPILEESGLVAGKDFGVAYSPERIDPGNKQYDLNQIPKVVGGINKDCTEVATLLYGTIIERVIPVRNTETAESVKIIENVFRNINIALVNEMALIFEKMGINIWEVIKAAESKPYGYMPFYPGAGVGGHCIPLDPLYLSYQSKKFGFIPRFIEIAFEINKFMETHVVNLVSEGLKRTGKSLRRANVTVIGLSYKKNISDIRESPSTKIIEELTNLGAVVTVYDPHVKSITTRAGIYKSKSSLIDSMKGSDCAVFIVDHDEFKKYSIGYLAKVMASPVIIDCKNLYKSEPGIIYIGLGKGEL